MELTVRSYELRWSLYLTEAGNLRPIPKWFTLFSYVVCKQKVVAIPGQYFLSKLMFGVKLLDKYGKTLDLQGLLKKITKANFIDLK